MCPQICVADAVIYKNHHIYINRIGVVKISHLPETIASSYLLLQQPPCFVTGPACNVTFLRLVKGVFLLVSVFS